MRRHPVPPAGLRLACLLSALALLPAAARADATSSAGSSASSVSVGSLSDSLGGSSNSSSNRQQAAAGDYRVVEVAEQATPPGTVRLTLQRVAAAPGAGLLWLDLPRSTWQRQRLGRGAVISALARPYGMEIARADTREAFFLLLADDWRGDLDARALTL